MRPHGKAKNLEQRRRDVVTLWEKGVPCDEIARRLALTPRSVRRIWAEFKRGGPDALVAHPVPGRPLKFAGKFTGTLVEEVHRILQEWPDHRWTYAGVAESIHGRWGVSYHADHVRRLFKRHGLSLGQPQQRGLSMPVLTMSPAPSAIRSGIGFGSPSNTPLENSAAGRDAQDLLARSSFQLALAKFANISLNAGGDILLKADAEWRQAWVNYSLGNYMMVDKHVSDCVRLIRVHLGYPAEHPESEMIAYFQSLDWSARTKPVWRILCLALHVRGKAYTEQVVYWSRFDLACSAERALNQCLRLAEHVDRPLARHSQLWLAILYSGNLQLLRDAEASNQLQAKRYQFAGDLGVVYLQRAWGFFYSQAGNIPKAENFLLRAAEGFSYFGDARALGPTFYLLSKVAIQDADCRQARRYALAGAAVHPYSFVLQGLRDLRKQDQLREENFKATLEELWTFRTDAFKWAADVMKRLVDQENRNALKLMKKNIEHVTRSIGLSHASQERIAAHLI